MVKSSDFENVKEFIEYIKDKVDDILNEYETQGEFIIFYELNISINNLPTNVKEIWLNKNIKEYNIKLPFNCKILYF